MLSMSSFFFFNDTATTEIYTLSLHDALPISVRIDLENVDPVFRNRGHIFVKQLERADTHGDQRECLQQLERGDDPQPAAMYFFFSHAMRGPIPLAWQRQGIVRFKSKEGREKRFSQPARRRNPAGLEKLNFSGACRR